MCSVLYGAMYIIQCSTCPSIISDVVCAMHNLLAGEPTQQLVLIWTLLLLSQHEPRLKTLRSDNISISIILSIFVNIVVYQSLKCLDSSSATASVPLILSEIPTQLCLNSS